jgi:hypothetical protein
MAMARSWNQKSATPDPTTTGQFAELEKAEKKKRERMGVKLPKGKGPSVVAVEALFRALEKGRGFAR